MSNVEEMAGLAADEIQRRIESDEAMQELFFRAVDTASRSHGERKREALAKAVAVALIDDANVDQASLMFRTFSALDEVHVQLLARIADAIQRRVGARIGQTETLERLGLDRLTELWRGEPDLLLPMLSTLVGEGVLERSETVYSGRDDVASWTVTAYGRRVLDALSYKSPPTVRGQAEVNRPD